MDAKRFYLRSMLLGLIIAGLTGCQKPPCEKYLDMKLAPKPVLLMRLNKPIPNIIKREYDLCLMEKQGVKIIRLGQTWRLIFPSDDVFVNDTSEIDDNIKPLLDVAADFIRTYSTISIEVAAYSDTVSDNFLTKFGTITDELTTRQANAIAKYLACRHINARLIYGAGKSDRDPVAWNGSPEGRYLNRRVEINFRYYRDNTAWY